VWNPCGDCGRGRVEDGSLYLKRPLGSPLALSKFMTYSEYSDDTLATFLNDKKRLTLENADDHKGVHNGGIEKAERHGNNNLSINTGCSELSLSCIDGYYVKTSVAIMNHVQSLQSLTLDEDSTRFHPRDLARIF